MQFYSNVYFYYSKRQPKTTRFHITVRIWGIGHFEAPHYQTANMFVNCSHI